MVNFAEPGQVSDFSRRLGDGRLARNFLQGLGTCENPANAAHSKGFPAANIQQARVREEAESSVFIRILAAEA
jgi:hypothetical protein